MLFPYMQNGSFDLLCCHIYINMIRSVVHLAKREVSALQKNTNKMQIRSNMMCCHLILYIITRSDIKIYIIYFQYYARLLFSFLSFFISFCISHCFNLLTPFVIIIITCSNITIIIIHSMNTGEPTVKTIIEFPSAILLRT